MAPMKRPRAGTVDDDGGESLQVDSLQLELRQDTVSFSAATSYSSLTRLQRKRARISETGTYSRASDARSDDSEDGPRSDLVRDEDGEAGDYERRRDAGFKDLVDEDMDTMRATQILKQKNQKIMDNMPADNAIIESVTCINFMCHTKLHVALGPLINFIIGHNGSGKSAVLTAITLCLGGKATSTNRGQSLKSFIKEGQDSSTLIVKLKNLGYSAYQQEVYGDSIVVERHFSKAGTSGFKLKGASGRVISTKKADLEEICDYFALQIDNPMNVLTQDMSRQFLNNSSPREKYKFFVKGVQLEQLDQDYQLLAELIDGIENKLHARSDDIDILKNRAEKAKTRLAMSDKQNSLRDKVRGLGRQMAWAQVEQQEQILETYNRELREADAQIAETEYKARRDDQAFQEASHVFEGATEAAELARNSMAPIQEEEAKAKEQFEKAKGEALALQVISYSVDKVRHLAECVLQFEQRAIRAHLKAADARIITANQDIAEEQKKLAEADGGIHNRRLAEIEEKKEALSKAKDRYNQHFNSISGLEEDKKLAQNEHAAANGPIEQKRIEVQQCENQLQRLMRDRGQQQGSYHENMPRLIRAIQQDDRFREQPVGPIGNHVRLLKPVWSNILERSFGATLNSFIVTSKQDQGCLSNLMQRLNWYKPPALVPVSQCLLR
ncbi:MAG: Structural maintenance of chromosomes protein 6 [Pleopsidium flavum]|nr:MAG: Structural maintenance of chromosomes protein 6 [Pleopsidium flavum]